ncbi:LTA synthase family protein [Halomonas stenophila]|uniref:Phosphoglycerol transferase MdoB-like AlkP superfamily enzyme n=1 Tax=Halomonas stenophila TaxID=795312 RepID=A0A7W5ERY1_9GAMM|nr:LTA synthase family protein [Halomonas stenophila]MBB3230181.1 phosphoglycerol transferase MdoB-like AlkP superfamily enzyme [Halomonas stenophila]
MIATLWLPFLAGLGLTIAIEALLRPAVPAFWRRPWASPVVHLGSWTLLFALFLLMLQRPWFAAGFVAALQLVVVQSSNTKSQTLNEPFICQDFEYFLDALRHPRLYVPFFGIGLALAAGAAGALAIAAFLWLEPSLVTRQGSGPLLRAVATLLSVALLLLWVGLRHLPPATLEPQRDLSRLGLFGALWAYGRQALVPLDTDHLDSPFATFPDRPAEGRLPDLVVVQSESFFDPRDWCPRVRRDLLPHFDALCAAALHHGRLRVPAWGANTVRTECAFLTGLDESRLGIHRFNPYRQLARRDLPNLVANLRHLGYHTVCVHPYPASFYFRDRVMPRLGFERFLDIADFEPSDRDGQYIGDLAVAEKVEALLAGADDRPLFIFVITMENHGPLHLERPVPDDAYALLAAPEARPEATDDLAIYLRHLVNADRMIARLHRAMSAYSRPSLLAWYGDHVPIIPPAYRCFGIPDGHTHYAIWSPQANTRTPPQERHIADLGPLLQETLLAVAAARHPIRQPNSTTAGKIQHHQEQE